MASGRDALLQTALAHEQQGRLEEARAAYGRVLRRDPRNPGLLHRLGLVEARLGDLDRAVQLLRRAVAAQPGTDVLTNLGILLHRQGRPAEALAQFDRALALDGRNAAAASNRGLSLLRLQRPAEALGSFDRALAINPAYPEAHADRGLALRELDRTAEALDSFGQALRLRPDFPIVRFAAGQCRLMLCDFAAGWQGYEHRTAPPPPAEGVPRWTGTEDPAGKTVLLYAEQGLGDTLQFCRYAGPLAARGATVLLQVQAPLVPLMASLAGPALVLARERPPAPVRPANARPANVRPANPADEPADGLRHHGRQHPRRRALPGRRSGTGPPLVGPSGTAHPAAHRPGLVGQPGPGQRPQPHDAVRGAAAAAGPGGRLH